MLLIYLPQTSPRIDYVFDLVFKHEWEIEYSITNEQQVFENYADEKINYSGTKFNDEFFIQSTPLLSENYISKKDVVVEEKHGTKVLFPTDISCDLGFDVFSAIFYMVSRYEEYLPFTPDIYGRFKASESLAFRNNFLQKPVVNAWIDIFKNALQKKFSSLKITKGSFDAILTYDIDIAYKFKGRNISRTFGSAAKDILRLHFKNVFDRIKALLNIQKDPWDIYEDLGETITKNQLNSIFFFLLGDNTKQDKNLSYTNDHLRTLIKKIKSFSAIGIHPSFITSDFPENIVTEKERLENICHEQIEKSRQHFLKFKLPDTYNALMAAGISEDYSMGFPDAPGFRAGTCKPFYFYDLKNEKATGLKIFPVTCMDATFIYYSKISAEKSLFAILNLMKEIKKVNGVFIPIWHNNYLGENKKWKSVHDKTVLQIKAYLKK
jgi:hypothetical protein